MPGPATERVCPGSTLDHATHLHGVVGPDGRVHYVSPALPVDDDFRDAARRQGDPEYRYRLAGPCVENGCRQWTGTRCRVIDTVAEQARGVDLGTEVRPCAIRRGCRWFFQRGPSACHVCQLVPTDLRH